ncbi:unnamed protein product [Amoebophrya sp. A120]|nr:unnamed protein product [Amoebophrya sp. A120]|eukprot:GSA120T00019449001.1
MEEILKPRPRLDNDRSLIMPLLICCIMFFACKFIACLTAVACGGSGGVFAPALVLGAGLGGAYGGLLSYLFDDAYYQLLFVPVGMAAVFSAMIRLPLTSVVIVFEMTSVAGSQDSSKLVFPMLLCSMISYFVNSEVQPSTMWDQLMEQDNIDPKSLQQFLNAALENPIMSRRSIRASICSVSAANNDNFLGGGNNGNFATTNMNNAANMGSSAVSGNNEIGNQFGAAATRVSMSRGMGGGFNLERFSMRASLAAPMKRENSALSSASSILPRNFSSANEGDMTGGMHQDMVREALKRIIANQPAAARDQQTLRMTTGATPNVAGQKRMSLSKPNGNYQVKQSRSQGPSRRESAVAFVQQRLSMAFGATSSSSGANNGDVSPTQQVDAILQNAGLVKQHSVTGAMVPPGVSFLGGGGGPDHQQRVSANGNLPPASPRDTLTNGHSQTHINFEASTTSAMPMKSVSHASRESRTGSFRS